MVLLIKNGTVINPGDKTMTKADVLIKDGTVAEVAPAIKEKACKDVPFYRIDGTYFI